MTKSNREIAREIDALRPAHAEVCRERDAAVKLRNLDAEFVCGFMRVVREGETRVPPILAEKWVEAAKLFLEEGRTEKVAVPSDESWKDTWERAEQAEAERDELRAILQEQGIIYSGANTQKSKRFYLQLIERAEQAEAAAARLREALEGLTTWALGNGRHAGGCINQDSPGRYRCSCGLTQAVNGANAALEGAPDAPGV